MEITKKIKRTSCALIPYRQENGMYFVYLQKRDPDAKSLPGYFGFWGGGVEENESVEDGLLREIKEELDFKLETHKFFSRYEFFGSIKNIYYIEVDRDFEAKIKVLEGEYGKWFSEDEIFAEEKFIDEDKLVLRNLLNLLKGKNFWLK